MEKIIFATGNQGKMREIRSILSDINVEVLSMAVAGFEAEIEENGTSVDESPCNCSEAFRPGCSCAGR